MRVVHTSGFVLYPRSHASMSFSIDLEIPFFISVMRHIWPSLYGDVIREAVMKDLRHNDPEAELISLSYSL